MSAQEQGRLRTGGEVDAVTHAELWVHHRTSRIPFRAKELRDKDYDLYQRIA